MNPSVRPDRKTEAGRVVVAADLPSLSAWHAGWAVAVALVALGGRWLGGVEGPVLYGILAMIAPGVTGLGLLSRDNRDQRDLALAVWSLAALTASVLSGGLTGPLAGFVFMPLVAGLALGGQRTATAGAGAVAVAAVVGLIPVWLSGPPSLSPPLAVVCTLLAVGAAVLALRLSWRAREKRLLAAEAEVGRVEALLAAQPGLTLVLEPSGRIVAAYGAPPPAVDIEALFADGLIAAVHAPDRPGVLASIARALEGAEASVRFAPRVALDRRVQLILRRADSGGAPRLIAQAFDGTALYARELGLETARVEAEAREAGKTRFLANMSHELRTPLNAVLGFSDIMRQRLFGAMPERYAEYADNIHQAGGHLLDLINDVLDVSKIEAERYALTMEGFDAREVVSAAIALVRVSADDKGVALTGLLPPDILEVRADRRALKQITLNLLSNAVKFTPASGTVTVTLDAIGPYLELVVADTGVGIAPEDVRRLGRPFEQAGALDQRQQGTGLGLSLVRAFAELHGGRMSIDSTLGEGTAVTVRLPVALVPPVREPVPEGGAEIIPLPRSNGSHG